LQDKISLLKPRLNSEPSKEAMRGSKVSVLECRTVQEIREKVSNTLMEYIHLLPESKDARILLKPNLNSNMNALTGNTTDLRLLVAVIDFLKRHGYRNLIVGDGTSSGFYRNKINVAKRLKILKVVEKFDVEFINLNYEPSVEIDFEDGAKASVAKICLDTDFFINLPKMKTHFEATMSVCLKNLIGCLTGLENKQKVHYSLYKNMLHLANKIRPDLQVVDGLIAMEGPGPSKGTPIMMDLILVGEDPFLVDLVCAKLAGFDYKEVPSLRVAEDLGLFTSEHIQYVDNLDLSSYVKRFKRPKVNPLVGFINNQRWQKYFIGFRLAPVVNSIFNSRLVGRVLSFSGLRQDVFVMKDDETLGLSLVENKCDNCGVCSEYCPMALNLPEDVGNAEKGCILCNYCYFVCPQKAITLEGELGFLKAQIKQYDKAIREMVRRKES
jgi:uncharacterized protein (DUF362 family)/NAD-dependent dihydropyrimidine dehydrogenase PreA subunit